ncbi:glutathione S-transferase theta-1-like [Haematobia irritans]|uniref:glutathione S-transferase theta-1-like n=1 Tax=Haematobia irritans TaxID=7368 RepID=UPI003F4FDF57
MSELKYYHDLMGLPCRAEWIALKMSKTPFEDCPIAIRRFEQRTKEFEKINRFQKLPCIVDGDFHLSESVAILSEEKNITSIYVYNSNAFECSNQM